MLEKTLESPLNARRSNQSILKEINLHTHWKDWRWSCNTLVTWWEESTHWKRPWCWERVRAGGEGGDRRWDGWMASSTQWTPVWANSGRQWRTGKPGMLQSMVSQRAGHVWATEQQSILSNLFLIYLICFLLTAPMVAETTVFWVKGGKESGRGGWG